MGFRPVPMFGGMAEMAFRLTMWRRIILLFISVGLVYFTVVGLLSYRQLQTEKISSIKSNLSGQLKQLELVVDTLFTNIESGVLVLAHNPLVRTRDDDGFTNFTKVGETPVSYRFNKTEAEIRKLFAQHKRYYEYVNSVYMGRENGGFVRSHKRAQPTRYDPRERSWYKLAKDNPGQVMRTEPYCAVTTEDINIGTTTALVDGDGRVFGVVGMDVTLKDLRRFIINMKTDYEGRVALLNKDGEVLATTWSPLKNRNVKDVFPGLTERIMGQEAGCLMVPGKDLALCHITSPRLGWKVLIVTPMRSIKKEVFASAARLLLLMFSFLVILGILTGLGLQRFVVGPIRNLSDKAEEISRSGELSTFMEAASSDEIGNLSRSFNRMVAKLKEMGAQLRQRSDELEETVQARTAELVSVNRELENELGLRIQAENDLKIQQAYLKQLFDLSPEAIVLIDINNIVLRINSEFTHLFGYSREEALGRSIYDLILPPGEEKEGLRAKAQIMAGRKLPLETKRRHRDGRMIDVSLTGTAIELGGNHYGVYAIYRDITRQKKQEEELRRAKEAAEEADRLKSAFLAAMSHELRTPLNSIIGFTGILLQQLPGPLNQEQAKQMTMVQNSARHLLNLINDILDISKIEAGQVQLAADRFSFKEAVDNVLSSISPLAAKKGLELTSGIDDRIGEIATDRRRLEQVLLNLLSNAVKFTDHGTVRVEAQQDGRRLTVRVIDTGIGIKPEDRETLFEAFRQLDTGLNRQYEGTGLGLSICKKLVGLMGGEIRAESEGPDKGSTFSFDIPLSSGEPHE